MTRTPQDDADKDPAPLAHSDAERPSKADKGTDASAGDADPRPGEGGDAGGGSTGGGSAGTNSGDKAQS